MLIDNREMHRTILGRQGANGNEAIEHSMKIIRKWFPMGRECKIINKDKNPIYEYFQKNMKLFNSICNRNEINPLKIAIADEEFSFISQKQKNGLADGKV